MRTLALVGWLLTTVVAHAAPIGDVSNGRVAVSAVADGNALVGFRLTDDRGEVCTVSFGSLGDVRAAHVERTAEALRFTGLSAVTPTLGAESWLTVRLLPGDPYPEVSFHLDIGAFDQTAWEKVHGAVPFHFLACRLPGAEVFYQRGWPMGTPVVDEFPIRGKLGPGRTVGANWSLDWSSAPPLGAYPMPDVGLWKPSASRFLAYDFNDARLSDHSEKNVATAYAWRHQTSGEFFCLVWPFAEHYQNLRYPTRPGVVATRFRLLHSRAISGDDDPSQFIQQWVWGTYRDRLPGVPAMNDLGWLPGGCRPDGFGRPGLGRLYGTEAKPVFMTPGAVMANGLTFDPNSPVDYAYRHRDLKGLAQLKQDIDYLLPLATRQTIAGDDCVYWNYPVTGDGAAVFGPGVKSLHNCWGWQVGLALLDTWRNDHPTEDRLLPYVDGVVRFTRHILYTRNDYPDVPAAEFAWGAGPACTFLLRYWYTFRADPQRRELAALAHKLATSLLYRFMAIWPADNDEADNLDSSFFMEPNAGYPWLGAACSNEVWVYTFALAEMYVATGDPIVGQYLRGQLETWHWLYKDESAPAITAYTRDSLTERFGLYDEAAQPRGTRADFGGIWGGAENLLWPVGSSVARVLCGERAAMAFNRDGWHTDLTDYRCYGDGQCSFKLVRPGRPEAVDVSVTFPFFELRGQPVRVIGADGRTRDLSDGQGVTSFEGRPDTILVAGVRDGDTLAVGGRFDAGVAVLPCPIAKRRTPPAAATVAVAPGFTVVNLRAAANQTVRHDWRDAKSYAGLEPGRKWLFGVPFEVVEPETNRDLGAVRNAAVPVDSGRAPLTFLLVGGLSKTSRVELTYADGHTAAVPLDQAVPVLRGWPRLYEWQLHLVPVPTRGTLKAIKPVDAELFGVTFSQRAAAELPATFAALQTTRDELAASQALISRFTALRPQFERCAGHVALLATPPPNGAAGPLAKLLLQADLLRYVTVVTPEQVADRAAFNPSRFWVTLYFGGEEYVASATQQKGYDAGLQRYLAGGGTLLVLPAQPFPFYYAGPQPVVAAGQFGLPLCGSGADHRPDTIAESQVAGWEKPPAGRTLTFKVNAQQELLGGLPATFAFPSAASGQDLRWRPLANVLPAGDVYLPLITLFDQDGRSYGDAAAWIEHRSGPLSGAKLLAVWSTLVHDPALQAQLVSQALGNVLRRTLPPPASAVATRVARPPLLDGRLDDPVWQEVPALTDFHVVAGGGQGRQRGPTTAKLAWDNECLYVAFDCRQPDVWGTLTAHDGPLWEENVCEVYLDPTGTGQHYKEIEVSPRNTVVDLDIPFARNGAPQGDFQQSLKWDCPGLRTAAQIVKEQGRPVGYTVELAIPLAAISATAPKIGDSWRVQLYRLARDQQDPAHTLDAWAWSATGTFHEPEHFGRLWFGGSPFHDDFRAYAPGSDGAPNWSIASGHWAVTDGKFVGQDSGTDGWVASGAASGAADWADYRLKLNFQLLEAGSDHRDGAWIAFRHQDPSHAYSLNFEGNRLSLHKVSGATSTGDDLQLATAAVPRDTAPHQVTITARGAQLTVQLDGRPVIDVTDRDFNGAPALRQGGIVLAARRWTGSQGHTRVAFWGYEVEPLRP